MPSLAEAAAAQCSGVLAGAERRASIALIVEPRRDSPAGEAERQPEGRGAAVGGGETSPLGNTRILLLLQSNKEGGRW